MGSMNQGYEFLGTVIGAGILGFIIDKFAGTTPWGMMALIVLGFVSATIRAQKAMNKKESKKD
jgi:ATP synthase protein I